MKKPSPKKSTAKHAEPSKTTINAEGPQIRIENVAITNTIHHDPKTLEAIIEVARAVMSGNEALNRAMSALSFEGVCTGPAIHIAMSRDREP